MVEYIVRGVVVRYAIVTFSAKVVSDGAGGYSFDTTEMHKQCTCRPHSSDLFWERIASSGNSVVSDTIEIILAKSSLFIFVIDFML